MSLEFYGKAVIKCLWNEKSKWKAQIYQYHICVYIFKNDFSFQT